MLIELEILAFGDKDDFDDGLLEHEGVVGSSIPSLFDLYII